MYNCSMNNKSNTSVRLTPEATRLLKEMAKKLGISQTAVMEIMIREKAEAMGVE